MSEEIVNVVNFSIFGRSGLEGMKGITRATTTFQNLLFHRFYTWALALVWILMLAPGKQAEAQCQTAASTCNLTAITGAFTPTATYLGCADDSCSLYYLLPTAVTADSAENWAAGLGAHLTSIHSAAENDSIVKWAAAAGITGSVWIGLNDKANEGTFVWTDGSDTTYKNWKTGRPNGIGGNDDCVHLYVTGADSGKWNDTTCVLSLPAVVKVSLCMNLSVSNDTVCQGDTATLRTTVSMGSTPYTYSWSITGAADSLNVAPVNTSNFTVTVTDRYSCTAVDSGTVVVDTLPVVSLGTTDTICADTFKTLDAGPGGLSYLWNTADTTQTIDVRFSGQSWVQKTDSNGCIGSDTFNLVVDSIPNFNLGNDTTVCNGDTVTVRPNIIMPSYTWVWHDLSTGTEYKTDTTERVSVTATDLNGCTLYQERNVRLVQNPVVNIANDTTLCAGTIITLNGPGGFNYHRWIVYQDTLENASKSVDTNGTYFYFGLDTNNCPGEDTIQIDWDTIPVIDLGNDTSICQFDSIMLDAGPGYVSMSWSTGDTTQTVWVTNPQTYTVFVLDSNGCTNSGTSSGQIAVANDSLPEITALRNGLPGDTTFCNLDSVFLHNFVTDTNIEYSWNGGAFVKGMDTLIAKTAGKYILTGRDTNTCLNRDSLILGIDTLPVVMLTADTSICFGDSIMLTSNSDTNYSHVWNGTNLGKQDTLWVSLDSTHRLTLVDRNTTCQNTDSMFLYNDTLPVINLGPDTGFCDGDTLTLDAGTNYASYSWNNSTVDTNQTLRVATQGVYTVNVVDRNECKGSDTRVVVKYLLPLPNLGPDKEFCFGTPVSVPLDPGGGFSFYQWSSGRMGNEAQARRDTAVVQGVSWVIVTDSNGCSNTDSVLINASFLPTVNLGPDTSFCSGDKFTLLVDAGPGFTQYEWFENKSGTPVLLPTTGQIHIVQDTAAFLSVRITDNKGCTNMDSMRIVELALPVVNFFDSQFCEADRRNFTETLDAGFHSSYIWSTGETTRQITVTDSGKYTVTVTSNVPGNSCEGEGTKNVIMIPQPHIDWTGDTLLCKGTTLTLEAQKPGYIHYYWYEVFDDGREDSLMNPNLPIPAPPNDTVPDTTVTSMLITKAGTYKVYTRYFEDPFCFDSVQTTIREDLFPVIDFGIQNPDTTLCVGETLRLSPNFVGSTSPVRYIWQDGTEDSIYLARTTDLYTLSMTNDCGADIDEVFVTFDDCSNIFIPSAFTPNGDGDNDLWRIETLQKFLEFELEIYDRMGNVIWETNNPEVGWDGFHLNNGAEVANGLYIYKITYRSFYEYIEGVPSAPVRVLQGSVTIVR